MTPRLLPDHLRHEVADDIGRALEVDVDDLGELALGNVPEAGVPVDDSGVVEQQIGGPVGGEQPARPSLDLGIRGDIHGREVVRRAEVVAELLDGFLRPATPQDSVSVPDKFIHHGAAQTARHAGDEDELGGHDFVRTGIMI